MNIQQSFNQALYQAQIGAGLYAHSPAGQERAELKAAERNAEKAGQKTTEAAIAAIRNEQDLSKSIFESPIGETIETFGAQELENREKLLKLDPSDKNYQAYLKAKQGMESLQRSKEKHFQDKELRKKLLQGVPLDPEIQIQRTKVEVDNNGK